MVRRPKVRSARSPLSRAEREMMAVVVSATNACRYCVAHHAEALVHFWRDRERVDLLSRERPSLAGLSGRQSLLCRYAQTVAEHAGSDDVQQPIDAMRGAGLDDHAVLDATLVASYFNFVNRMGLALGVELEDDIGGYAYE